MTTLITWRHGRTTHNRTGRFQGQFDSQLDDLGRRQVADAARRLADRFGPRTVRVVASDLQRARHTAQAFTALVDVPLQFDARLREVDVGTWTDRDKTDVEADPVQGALVRRWRDHDLDLRAGGTGETRGELAARGLAGLRDALLGAGDDDVVVVAAHGAVLKAAVLMLTGAWPHGLHGLTALGNACWWQLEPVPGAARPAVDGPWRVVGAGGPGPDLVVLTDDVGEPAGTGAPHRR